MAIQYILEHPNEPKVSSARRFEVVDSTIHKWVKDSEKIMVLLFQGVLEIILVMKLKKLHVYVKSLRILRMH